MGEERRVAKGEAFQCQCCCPGRDALCLCLQRPVRLVPTRSVIVQATDGPHLGTGHHIFIPQPDAHTPLFPATATNLSVGLPIAIRPCIICRSMIDFFEANSGDCTPLWVLH